MPKGCSTAPHVQAQAQVCCTICSLGCMIINYVCCMECETVARGLQGATLLR